jgi:Peptidase family M1 domain
MVRESGGTQMIVKVLKPQAKWFSLFLGLASMGAGCAVVPKMAVTPQRYRLDVQLDEKSHEITARATIDLIRTDDDPLTAGEPVAVELLLHPDLKITAIRAAGAKLRSSLSLQTAPQENSDDTVSDDATSPRRHNVFLAAPAEAFTLYVDYKGKLFQDASEGEVAGQIHNFKMSAHLGEDGVYLAGGYWYPEPALPKNTGFVADFTLTSNKIPGFALAASGETAPDLVSDSDRVAWRSPFPLQGMVLVGGAHEVHEQKHGDITIRLHLKPDQARHVEGLFAATRRNLDNYQPLIGDYPASEYTIVDNFFSSGFAFPTFTLLSSAVINMGERAQTGHGYLDHEMLHSWWGNSIHVDPQDGNWCEALASYGANYYGYVLDGDEDEARRKRRNFSHFLSRIKPEDDKPLGTFGQKDGCGRKIAYNKGAAVFHMLATTIGQDTFWSAMRRLTAERVGTLTSWGTIRQTCEKESGKDLSTFFDQWIRGAGAPRLSIEKATYSSANQSVTLTITQPGTTFALDIPLRFRHVSGSEDVTVSIDQATQDVTVPVNGIPQSVELDPDYHLFRKVAVEEIIPTTATTRYGTAFTSILPSDDSESGPSASAYEGIQKVFARSFEDDERMERVAGDVEGEALAERCALILGDAVRDPYISAFLAAIEFPVTFDAEGFSFDDEDYTDPEDAILATVAHPGLPGGGITVVFANSDAAIPSAFVIPMYDRSVVVFKNKRAVHRQDLEHRAVVIVGGS